MPLNTKEPYVEIWGEDRGLGIVYGQNQDDGTGRLVRRNFTMDGWEVDGNGKIVDPLYISPEEQEMIDREAARKKAPTTITAPATPMAWDEPDLMIADRVKIKDPNTPGYLEREDIQGELKKLDVSFHPRAGREKLMKILKEELNIGLEP